MVSESLSLGKRGEAERKAQPEKGSPRMNYYLIDLDSFQLAHKGAQRTVEQAATLSLSINVGGC